jgi:hypothetical protein
VSFFDKNTNASRLENDFSNSNSRIFEALDP